MKVRNGFVSNSSSSSFVVRIDDINTDQLDKLFHHIDNIDLLKNVISVEYLSLLHKHDAWKLIRTQDFIIGETIQNNFPMDKFLKVIGIKESNVFWDENPFRL